MSKFCILFSTVDFRLQLIDFGLPLEVSDPKSGSSFSNTHIVFALPFYSLCNCCTFFLFIILFYL